MCQYQLSSVMLPREAPMPPCAATVCDGVGKTLDSTATLRPASASCSEACMPEPPAPTITASKRRDGMEVLNAMSHLPQNLRGPAGTADQPKDGGDLQRKPQSDRLDVIHPDVAHADPGVVVKRGERHESGDLEPLFGKQSGPAVVGICAAGQKADEQDDGIDRHHDGGDALRQPILH